MHVSWGKAVFADVVNIVVAAVGVLLMIVNSERLGYFNIVRLFTFTVKDPLFLVDAFERWRQSKAAHSEFFFVLIGPSLDDNFTLYLKEYIVPLR